MNSERKVILYIATSLEGYIAKPENGIRLFGDDRPEQNLKLESIKQFDKGLVQLHYKRL